MTDTRKTIEEAIGALDPHDHFDIIAKLNEALAQQGEPYKDSTPELSVGDSSFESWYASYDAAHKGDKQRARDAYAAGMGDPLLKALAQQGEQPFAYAQYLDKYEDWVFQKERGDCRPHREVIPLYTAAPAAQQPDVSTWCKYIAGMIGFYIGDDEDSERVKAIAKIIERRLWSLPKGAAPAAQPTCKQDLQVETEQERYVRMCPDIECGRKKQCTRVVGVSCMSRADIGDHGIGADK